MTPELVSIFTLLRPCCNARGFIDGMPEFSVTLEFTKRTLLNTRYTRTLGTRNPSLEDNLVCIGS